MADQALDRVMQQLESHLTFAATLVSSAHLADHSRELGKRLDGIRERHADRNLYLAVVGEFSTGKSTFVNALIGEPLLPTSAVITTAVPTELAPGANPAVRLQLAGANRTWVLPRDHSDLTRELRRRGVPVEIPAKASDALRILVTSDEVGALVSLVRYSNRSDFLGDDIVVVDTPGLDASADHDEATERVVADRADAFVVLTASHSAFRRYLEGFLRSHLRDHLHRSIFVVTKMDQVDDDPARFERITSQRLRRIVEPAQPRPIHYLALGPAQAAGAPGAADWAERFEDFRASLREQLRLNRAVVLAETTARLLESLLARISELVSEKRQEVAARQRQLDAISMPDVPGYLAPVTKTLQSGQQARFDQARNGLRRESASIRLDLTAEIRQHIAGIRAMPEFRTYVNGFGSRATSAVTRLSDYAARVADDAVRQDSAALTSAVEDFRREYAKVESLRRGVLPAPPGRVSVPAPKLSPRAVSAGEFAQSAGVTVARSVGGAALGALIGSMFAPGPGTLIGAGIGALFGADSTRALEKAKPAGQAGMIAEVDRLFTGAEAELIRWLTTCSEAEQARIAALTAELSARYEPGVREVISGARKRQDRLQRERRQLDDLAADLRKRIRALSDLREFLAAVGADARAAVT